MYSTYAMKMIYKIIFLVAICTIVPHAHGINLNIHKIVIKDTGFLSEQSLYAVGHILQVINTSSISRSLTVRDALSQPVLKDHELAPYQAIDFLLKTPGEWTLQSDTDIEPKKISVIYRPEGDAAQVGLLDQALLYIWRLFAPTQNGKFAATEKSETIRIFDDGILPRMINVPINTTVHFKNFDFIPHQIKSAKGHNFHTPASIESPRNIMPGDQWSYTFTSIGAYPFYIVENQELQGIIYVHKKNEQKGK